MTEPRFHAPRSLEQLQALYHAPGDALLVAGGQWSVPLLRAGDLHPDQVISLSHVDELKGISSQAGRLRIGAGESHRAIAASERVQTDLPVLAQIAAQIGDAATRNRGTLGGAIGSDPGRSDYAAPLIGLNATLITSRRARPAASFYESADTAKLAPGEILIAVEFDCGGTNAFRKIANPAANFADAAVLVATPTDGSRSIVACGDALWPQRVTKLEDAVAAGGSTDVAAIQTALPDATPLLASRLAVLARAALAETS